ncbi:transposase [Streptococcus iniae]|nr:transposase [Streptococcus iniae]
MSRKVRRHFTDDFKQQIVDLYNAGRPHQGIRANPFHLR